MSLFSRGQDFKVSIMLTGRQRSCLIRDPQIDKPLELMYDFQASTSENSLEAKKQAFMKAMEDFSNSQAFEAAFYELHTLQSIRIEHSVHTSMF